MASRISTLGLVQKCRTFIAEDRSQKALDYLIKESIIKADRDLRECDPLSPLAWDIVPYDSLPLTRYNANISAITAANPGVITADSADSDITGHGFHNHSTIRDVIVVNGIDAGMTELNDRIFLSQYVSATTFSLKSFDGLSDINTTDFDAYTAGGTIYHAGYVLNTTTILTDVASMWEMGRILPNPTFGMKPTTMIGKTEAESNPYWLRGGGGRPQRWRYWENMTDPDTPTINHYLLWYPPCNGEHVISFNYRKDVADISTWNSTTYPFHPAEAHDALWHGALANLVGQAEKMKRVNDKSLSTKIEVMYAERWLTEWEKDKRRVRKLSRKLLGDNVGSGDITG